MCKVHSHVEIGPWQGMVGTAQVPAGGGTPGSGVDFTEYRVTAAAGSRSENTADEDPFETSFTVSAAGDHLVEYRSTDNAGNQEAIKSVAFSIADGDPDAPRSRAFADPSTGAAPLLVQFSATGLDPQGGQLIYEWDFGDGGGSFNQSPTHTYTTAGTYTAKVTATDRAGQDRHRHGPDRRHPDATGAGGAARRRSRGPGWRRSTVQFSAQATDPDGDPRDLPYLWDFATGARPSSGPTSSTPTGARTYTATVMVTDSGGAFDTAEVRWSRIRRATCRRPCRRRRPRGPAPRRCG